MKELQRILSYVRRAADEYDMIRAGDRICVGVSAGKDSLTLLVALAELRRATNPAFPGFSNGLREESCAAFFEGGCRIFRADNTPLYDRQSYCDRALSSSYSLKEGDARYADYRAALEAIFDRFSVGGVLAVPTRTVAFAGTV